MDTDYHQEGQYSDYDDTGLYIDDYDDKVFATLNSYRSWEKAPPKLLLISCLDIYQIEINYV